MNRMTALALLVAAVPACVVYPSHPGGGGHPVPTTTTTVVTNVPPYVTDASAYVYYDGGYRDDIWAFDAFVDDANGIGDVTQVWADVYDQYAGPDGVLVDSYELYPTDDPYEWYSDWLGSSTPLDPFYDGYTVDFVVYDQFDDFGYLTVWAQTY